jgi:Polysaccharide lyase
MVGQQLSKMLSAAVGCILRILSGRPAFAGAALVLAVVGTVALAPQALAATGSPSSPQNLSDNPILASNATGWSTVEGGTAVARVSVTDHTAATKAARTTSSATTTRMRLPSEPVTVAGQAWTYAADVKASKAGATASVTVEWLTSAGAFISYNEGSFATLSSANWSRTVVTATPPANAATARTQINVINTASGSTVQVTQHDVRAPAGPPPGQQIFNGDFETGNFNQWPLCQTTFYNNPCTGMPANYPLTIEPGHQGSYAGRFEVRDGDMPFCCGERAQIVNETGQPLEAEGQDLWYDWDFMIDQQYPITPDWQVLMQWHSDVDGSPPLAFDTENNNLILQTRPRPNAPYTGITNVWSTPFVKGQWADIKMHIKWSADANVGTVEIWKNGVKQSFSSTPTEHGNGTSCVGQQICHFRNIYPGDAGNTAMVTYYRDQAITGTGVVHHDNFNIATSEAALNSGP